MQASSSPLEQFSKIWEHEAAPGDFRKKKIIEAAIALLSVKGYDELCMNAVAKRAGISKSNLFYHFGSKKDLFLACINYTRHRFARFTLESLQAKNPQSYRAKLEEYFRIHFDIPLKFPQLARVRLLGYYMMARNADLKLENVPRVDRGTGRIESFLSMGEAAGEFKLQAPAKQIALFMQRYLTGAMLSMCTEDRKWATQQEFAECMRVFSTQVSFS